MSITRGLSAGGRTAAVLVAALALLVGFSAPAGAHTKNAPGTSSLAALLAQDTSGFDRNWNDFDITSAAVTAVLTENPKSAVAVLADGTTPLTAFLPTDRAFRNLAEDLSGKQFKSESAVFSYLASTLGVPTIENVLLYHVVPGSTISYKQALRSNGAVLTTALTGATLTVKVKYCFFISLKDQDPNDRNAYVVEPNLNKGNLQIAHGISEVLRPVDL